MFGQQDTRIFSYTFNGQTLYADPIETLIRLKLACNGRLSKLTAAHNVMQGFPSEGISPEDAASFTPTPAVEGSAEHIAGMEARLELARATIVAFVLQPFDPQTGMGTLSEDAIALYIAFTGWLAAKKKPTA